MGIDFNGLINMGRNIAGIGGDRKFVDTDVEKNLFDKQVQLEAANAGVDASEIYNNTDISSLMGVTFSAKAETITEDDTDMLFALAGIKKSENKEEVTRMSKDAVAIDGIDFEFLENVLPEEVQGYYVAHQTDGTAKRVGQQAVGIDNDVADAEQLEMAYLLLQDAQLAA